MKRANGFTLIELIVVIAIIGILAAVMMGTFSGGSDSARAARCMTNMRNLAAACQSYGMATDFYPAAGSIEYFSIDASGGKRNLKESYHEIKGWISWNSQGAYRNNPTSPKATSGWITSCYDQNEVSRTYALTNGALWKYVSGSHEVYVCPHHRNVKSRLNPNWSYVMNAYFGWTARPGTDIYTEDDCPVHWYREFKRADRYLLFAEIPFANIGVQSQDSESGLQCDAVLQYKDLDNCTANETIGFNHRSGQTVYANVVFADGHTEKIAYPKNGLSVGEQQDLTTWLCTGRDISFDGAKYEKMAN